MSGVRVLVGTRKGAFVLESDGKREKWNVQGPFFAGFNIYHMKGSPVDPNRIYASQCSDWFGQLVQRSDDGGKSWEVSCETPYCMSKIHVIGSALADYNRHRRREERAVHQKRAIRPESSRRRSIW